MGNGDRDDSLEPQFVQPVRYTRASTLGGVAPTPISAVQLPLHLDLFRARPMVKVIQADLSDPIPAPLLNGRPGSEPTLCPQSKNPGMGLRRFLVRQRSVLMGDVPHDVGIGEHPGVLVQVRVAPRAQDEVCCFDLATPSKTGIPWWPSQ